MSTIKKPTPPKADDSWLSPSNDVTHLVADTTTQEPQKGTIEKALKHHPDLDTLNIIIKPQKKTIKKSEYTSQEALKEWEAAKDQNNLSQNIVALLGIHGMHCEFYKYQNASHITKAFEDLIHHQLQKAREEEVRLFMTTMQDRANTIRPNLLLNEIVNYAHDRLKVLNQAELNQDPAHDFFTAPEEVQRPVYERALQKAQEEQEKLTNNQTL